MDTFVFMLILVNANSFSHSYTVNGFQTMQSCEAAIPKSVAAADKLAVGMIFSSTRAVCIEAKK